MSQVVLCCVFLSYCCFFFQAEDGIRDDLVTGVQTCALPICPAAWAASWTCMRAFMRATQALASSSKAAWPAAWPSSQDRKSTRLNSSHQIISYAVFCLKKKKKKHREIERQQRDLK